MEFTELVGITLNVDFNYKTKDQMDILSPLLWEDDHINKILADMLSVLSVDFFNKKLEKLNVPNNSFKILSESFIYHDKGFDELFEWISLDIDIQTNSLVYDNIFDFMEGNSYEESLIDELKKNIIKYFSKVNLEKTVSIKIEITEFGGN